MWLSREYTQQTNTSQNQPSFALALKVGIPSQSEACWESRRVLWSLHYGLGSAGPGRKEPTSLLSDLHAAVRFLVRQIGDWREMNSFITARGLYNRIGAASRGLASWGFHPGYGSSVSFRRSFAWIQLILHESTHWKCHEDKRPLRGVSRHSPHL